MTLVVARCFSTGPRLLADWRITDPNRARASGFGNGALKVWLLSANVVVAYAGNQSRAELLLRSVATSPVRELINELRLATDLRDDLEFLVVTQTPNELHKVTAGSVATGSAGWIGDESALAAYRKHLNEAPHTAVPADSPDWVAPWIASVEAFRRTVDDSAAPSIGELMMHVVPQEGRLTYAPMASLVSGFTPQVVPSGVWTTAEFGSAADGAFGYTVLAPDVATPAIGLYFPHGRLGIFHWPLQLDEPVFFADVAQSSFQQQVHDRYGVWVSGAEIS